MSDALIIKIDLEKGDTNVAFSKIEKDANLAGSKSGKNFSNKFNIETERIGTGLLKSFSQIAAKATLVTSAITGALGAFSLRRAINEAIGQENAINSLNNALIRTGEFSQETSLDFQNFASSIQGATKFGDDLILSQLSIAKSFGATNNQAKDIVKTATDLSAALGINLDSAVEQLSGTLNGVTGRLSKLSPEISRLTKEQLEAGAVIDILSKKLQGAAAGEVNTYSGALTQLKNSFGDLLEEFGLFIIKSPEIIILFKEITMAITRTNKSIENNRKEFSLLNDIIRPLTNSIIDLGAFINIAFIKPFEIVLSIIGSLTGSIATAINGVIAVVIGGLSKIDSEILKFFGIESTFQKTLDSVASSTFNSFTEQAEKTNSRLNNIFEQSFSTSFEDQLIQRRAEINSFYDDVQKRSDQFKNEQSITLQQLSDNNAKALKSNTSAVTAAQLKLAEDQKKILESANRVINQGLTRVVSGGIQNITNALVKGKAVFADFGNFILSSFGDLAIQLGEFYVATGLANLALLSNEPAAQIATGAALIAVGSILKSFFSGSSSTSGGDSSGVGATATNAGSSGFNQSDLTDDPAAIETRNKPDASVQITIQGNVFDSEETGTQIARILSESFNKKGVVLTDARFA